MARFLRVVVALCFMVSSRLCVADGVFLNGVSPRSIGRGGTNLGFADNGGVIFDNPAAMTSVPGAGLIDVGVDVLITDFEYSDPQNVLATDSSATPLPQISAIGKTADGRFAYGLGVFVPAGFSETYDMQGPPPLVGPRHYESFGSLVKVLPAVAWQATDRLSVGATLGAGISRAELEGPYFLQSLFIPTVLKLEADGAAVVGSAGLQYQLTDTTTLGLAYQSETRMDLEGEAFVSLAPGMQTTYDADVHIKWPRSVGLGIRQVVATRHVFSADVVWFNWSEAFDSFAIRLSSPTSGLFPPGVNEQFPLNWRDTISVRLGYEFDLGDERTVRLGYVNHRNPIPNSTLTPFIQSIMEQGLSCGYGFAALGCEIDLSYMFTFGRDEHVGTSAFFGSDFTSSDHRAQTHAICVSVIRRF